MENYAHLIPQSPIAFKLPHLKTDVSLKVFYAEFQVHSTVLKLHSEFFRRFLDSPDKANVPPGVRFLYEYVTVLDKWLTGHSDSEVSNDDWDMNAPNNGWNLEVSIKANPKNIAQAPRDHEELSIQKGQVDNFGKLLRAMYGLSCQFDEDISLNLVPIEDFVDMAEYFGTLPIASMALDSMLCSRPPNFEDRTFKPVKWIQIAYRTRHATLFKDCTIILAGGGGLYGNDEQEYKKLKREIRAVVEMTKLGVYQKVLPVTQYLISISTKVKLLTDEMNHDLSSSNPFEAASFYWNLHSRADDDKLKSFSNRVLELISPLMDNNLTLVRGPPEDWERRFLCGEVADEDLPWKPWGEE